MALMELNYGVCASTSALFCLNYQTMEVWHSTPHSTLDKDGC